MKSSATLIVFLFLLISCSQGSRHRTLSNSANSVKQDSIFSQNKLTQIRVFQNDKINEIQFFHEDGSLRKVVKYMYINNDPTPNQFIVFGKEGDTLKRKSLYYDLYCIKDTLEVGEKYQFKIILTGHVFDSAMFYLCNYNKNFVLDTAHTECSLFSMDKQPLSATVAVVKYTKGWNYIRGRIDNYQNYNDQSGMERNTHASVYFIDSFYVK